MIDKFTKGVIYPVPPAFKDGILCPEEIKKYLTYLYDNGAKTILVTAGTSRFNFLSDLELIKFNTLCSQFGGNVVLGIPPTSNVHAKNYIIKINELASRDDVNVDGVLCFYPDRYYDDKSIVEYFNWLADELNVPVMVHGMPMRKASGGMWEYNTRIIEKIKRHPNIIGMKEESPTIDGAYEVCKSASSDFLVFPAGGSCRRFLLTHPRGAQTFLGGIGNIFPQIEEYFFNRFTNGDVKEAYRIVVDYEEPVFDVFKPIGWHKALQEALNYKGLLVTENRKPFSDITDEQKLDVHKVIDEIEEKWNG